MNTEDDEEDDKFENKILTLHTLIILERLEISDWLALSERTFNVPGFEGWLVVKGKLCEFFNGHMRFGAREETKQYRFGRFEKLAYEPFNLEFIRIFGD